MKKFLQQILLVLIFLAAIAPNGFSQNADQNAANANNSQEITQENDRLPFMQEDQLSAKSPAAESGTGFLLLRTLGAMLLIVGLIFFGAWGLKKSGYGGVKKNLEIDAPELSVVTSVSLGANRTLATVKFGNRILLVGSTAQSFTLLAEETGDEQTEEDFIALNQPRSVAEILNEHQNSFENNFAEAQKRVNTYDKNGGAI